jgi:hypothetical protein
MRSTDVAAAKLLHASTEVNTMMSVDVPVVLDCQHYIVIHLLKWVSNGQQGSLSLLALPYLCQRPLNLEHCQGSHIVCQHYIVDQDWTSLPLVLLHQSQ